MEKMNKPRKLAAYFMRFAASFCLMTLLALAVTVALYIFAQIEWIKLRIGDPIIGFVALFVVLFISGALILSIRFARKLGEKLAPLTDATQRIKVQDLDFAMPQSDIREIDDVLGSMDDMKVALKTSLKIQWESEQARTAQLAALTHDIQTPLTIIRGNAELLNQTVEAEKPKRYSDYIMQGALRIERYMLELNALTKVGAVADIAQCDAGQFYQDLASELEAMCAAKHITIECNDTVPDVRMRADQEMLFRAFTNVFDNAVRHSPCGGLIRFGLQHLDGHLLFSIEDSGPGFSDEALLKAKDQYFSEQEDASGHGIGLYIADQVVQKHGGKLTIENAVHTSHGKVIVQIPVA